MKKILILSSLFTSLIFITITTHATEPHVKTSKLTSTKSEAIDKVSVQNKKIVIDFYEGVFLKHKVKEYADHYIGQQYIQHNPNVPDGKAPFVNFFTEKFQKNPQAKNEIKRAIAEGNLVVLHVHSTENEKDRGRAIIDIFRVENGKIVEHWDVIQNIPEQSKNTNTMF
ncbi:ester cyclase [Acinetobacter calcoaceticus]|uniref:nuclear transport factor 2 family protein n=1 Tax=Acinetobacter calcoaceticus TaxID=471 RepID=UPI0019020E23|nr:ester cyclase [Acinetobacter calcoaceticus]MBJ9704655.1 ester cyclase [Acinetobacter calcoaceticus]